MPSPLTADITLRRPSELSSAFYRARHADRYAAFGIAIMRWRNSVMGRVG
jgi:hypothetical protein